VEGSILGGQDDVLREAVDDIAKVCLWDGEFVVLQLKFRY
jgi:hypothetical protein